MFHNIPVNEKRQENNDQTKPQAHFTKHNNKLTSAAAYRRRVMPLLMAIVGLEPLEVRDVEVLMLNLT